MEVEDATAFSNLGAPPAPARVPAWKARLQRLTDRTALHDLRVRQQGDCPIQVSSYYGKKEVFV